MAKNDEILELNIDDIFRETPDEIEEHEIEESRQERSKVDKITYEPVYDRNKQKIKGLRKKIKNGKLFGYEATFCYGYKDVYNKKKKKMEHKQITERKSFSDKEAALKWYRAKEKEKSDLKEVDKKIEKDGYTIEQICDLYYNEMKLQKRGKGYLQQLRIQKDHFMKFFIEDKKYVKKISTQDIIDYFRFEEKNGYCCESVEKYKSHLKMMWDFMLRDPEKYQIKKNVVIDAPVNIQSSQFESIALSYSEFMDYLYETLQYEEVTYLFLLVFSYVIGLRRGEIAGLQWGDINWEKKNFLLTHNRVQRTKKDKEDDDYDDVDERNVKLPKRDKVRLIAMPNVAYDTLVIYKEWQEKILKREVKPDEFVLQFELTLVNGYDPNVSKISVRWREFQTRINKQRAKAGKAALTSCRLHDGRETMATLSLDGVMKPGGTIIEPVIKYQLYAQIGHSYKNETNNTTEGTYHKVTDERWDYLRFWNELIDIDIKEEYQTYCQIREIEEAQMREDKRLKRNEAKRRRYEKAKEEREAAKEEKDIIIELKFDDEE